MKKLIPLLVFVVLAVVIFGPGDLFQPAHKYGTSAALHKSTAQYWYYHAKGFIYCHRPNMTKFENVSYRDNSEMMPDQCGQALANRWLDDSSFDPAPKGSKAFYSDDPEEMAESNRILAERMAAQAKAVSIGR